MTESLFDAGMVRGAWLSPDGRYRYGLTRDWSGVRLDPGWPHRRGVCWVMLNPSTADDQIDDPTIRRCLGFTRAWGYEQLVVVNAFGLRATDPKQLLSVSDPVGPENATAIDLAIDSAQLVVAAWGASFPPLMAGTIKSLREQVRSRGGRCLGKTQSGHPRHPLYVRADTRLVDL